MPPGDFGYDASATFLFWRLAGGAGVRFMFGRQPLVLIAYDDEAVRDAFQFVLRLEEIEVHAHGDGAQLLEDRELGHADCLILRDRMPQMDGFELLHRLHARKIALPAILLMGAATPALQVRAAAAGVCLVLQTPVMDNALVEGVLRILRQRQAAVAAR
jgi:FixJ family two-component response regulator